MKSKFTPDCIKGLEPNQIFVFGSNLNGHHAGGAARFAYDNFEAQLGVGVGITGRCYAFPTLDKEMKRFDLDELKTEFVRFINAVCWDNGEHEFLVTKVGCGIAGYSVDEVADSFWRAVQMTHYGCAFELRKIVLPKEFVRSETEKQIYDIWADFRDVSVSNPELYKNSYTEAESRFNSFLYGD